LDAKLSPPPNHNEPDQRPDLKGTELTDAELRRLRDPVIGSEVSGYVVKGQLGQGGMGIVYEGEQPTIGKRVAIKVLRHEVADNPDVVQRLVAEARAVNQVGHRGIIDVFGVGQLPDGRQCIVMEFLEGESLEAVLNLYREQQRLMPVDDVLVIFDEILSALSAAHRAGVVHRDVKPSNIFLCRQPDGSQYVKLLDFGIAKLGALAKATPTTRNGMMMGTPMYMAPEQARMASGAPSMDLYALGVMLFEMLTNQLPFVRDSIVSLLLAHQNDPPARPTSLVPTVPAELEAVVLKLLEKDVARRYQTADELKTVLAQLRKQLAREPVPVVVVRVQGPPAPTQASLEHAATAISARHPAVQPTPEPVVQPVAVAAPAAHSSSSEDLAAIGTGSSRRWWLAAAVVAGLAALGVWLSRDTNAATSVAAVEPVPAVAAPVAAPTVVVAQPAVAPVAVVAAPEVADAGPVAQAAPGPVVVAPAPVVAVPQTPSAAPPHATTRPKPRATPRGTTFEARLDAVAARLKQVAAQGEDVSLNQRQVEMARALLRGELTDQKREQLELVLTRLEEDASQF
jgi:serine/threonine-protein kinase